MTQKFSVNSHFKIFKILLFAIHYNVKKIIPSVKFVLNCFIFSVIFVMHINISGILFYEIISKSKVSFFHMREKLNFCGIKLIRNLTRCVYRSEEDVLKSLTKVDLIKSGTCPECGLERSRKINSRNKYSLQIFIFRVCLVLFIL